MMSVMFEGHQLDEDIDIGMVRRIKQFFPNQRFEKLAIAAVMTGPYVNAFGLVWDVHKETSEVTIRSPLRKGRHQEIRVSMEIVVLGGVVIDPYNLCMMEDQGDE